MRDPAEDPRAAIEGAETLIAGASGTPTVIDASPRWIDRYEILGFLGAGGMGAVYRVRDGELGELVALKMLRADIARDPAALDRFRDEVRLARRVTHRNVARTFDIGEHEGQRFLTMELIDGRSLAAILGERGLLPSAEVVAIAGQICAGLSAAHQVGVIHSDLKPENVMIAADGRAVITDFGIARTVGAAGQIAGTPAYMAPEQILGVGANDPRVDLYALGAVLFELFTGRHAWPERDLMAALSGPSAPPDPRRHRPELAPAFAAIVQRCLEHDPRDRFDDADAVALALTAALAAETPRPGLIPAAAIAGSAPSTGKTVAILPLRNSGPPEDAYLADGLTDDLIDTLSMTRGLRVRPRGVVARYRESERDPQEIGGELGVQVIVEGSVRRQGDKVRLGLRLIGVADGFQLWARRFDAPLHDLLTANAEAAGAIAAALTAEVPEHRRLAPVDPAAVDLYLRAKFEYWRSWHASTAQAALLFERALALAPDDPLVLTGLASALTRMSLFSEGDEATRTRARELSERAVAVAPGLGDAWAALATSRLHDHDLAGTARALRVGLTHAPASALLQDLLGRMLNEVGPVDEAIRRLRLALELDPTLVSARTDLARAYALEGEWARADAELDTLSTDELHVPRDSPRSRFKLWQRAPFTMPKAPRESYLRVCCDLLAGGVLTAEHRAFIRGRAEGGESRLRPFFYQRNAEFHAFVGEVDEAFEATRRAIESGLIDRHWMDRCPLLADLREDPRWPALRVAVDARASSFVDALALDLRG